MTFNAPLWHSLPLIENSTGMWNDAIEENIQVHDNSSDRHETNTNICVRLEVWSLLKDLQWYVFQYTNKRVNRL